MGKNIFYLVRGLKRKY